MVYPLKIPDRLCCDRCFLCRLILRQRIDEIPSDMSHAAAVLYTGNHMISAVSVTHQIAIKALQKSLCIFAFPGRLVVENDDAAVIQFPVAVYPHLRLGSRFPAFLMQHLYACLVCMDNVSGKQHPVHFLHYRHTPFLCRISYPV